MSGFGVLFKPSRTETAKAPGIDAGAFCAWYCYKGRVVSYFVILSTFASLSVNSAKDLADRENEILRSLRSLRMTC
jgi:hypothetical protein